MYIFWHPYDVVGVGSVIVLLMVGWLVEYLVLSRSRPRPTDGPTDGQTDGRTGRRTDRQKDGRRARQTEQKQTAGQFEVDYPISADRCF